MAIDVQTVGAPMPSHNPPRTPTEDERWNAWRAKGDVHDRLVRRRMTIALPLLGIGVAILSYVFLGR